MRCIEAPMFVRFLALMPFSVRMKFVKGYLSRTCFDEYGGNLKRCLQRKLSVYEESDHKIRTLITSGPSSQVTSMYLQPRQNVLNIFSLQDESACFLQMTQNSARKSPEEREFSIPAMVSDAADKKLHTPVHAA